MWRLTRIGGVLVAAAFALSIIPHAVAKKACPEFRISTLVPGPPSKRANFTALIAMQTGPLTYTWSISSGKIVKGQGQPSLFVEGPGVITATVEIGGFPSGCASAQSATVEIP